MLPDRELTVVVQTSQQAYEASACMPVGDAGTTLPLSIKIKNKFNFNGMFLELNSKRWGFANRNFSDKKGFGFNNLFLIKKSENSLKQIIKNQKHKLINERESNENKTNTNRLYALLYEHAWKPPS